MAEFKGKGHKKHEKIDQKHRTRHENSQPSPDKFHSWEHGALSIGETPFSPSIDKHTELLSMATSDEAVQNLLMRLHQTYGNRYVQRLIESVSAQAKLKISNPNDVYEQEADTVARVVTRAINAQLQRQAEPEEEEEVRPRMAAELQRQPEEEEELRAQSTEGQPDTVPDSIEARINNARGNGHPISEAIREPMEKAFGADFSDVRVHTNSEADTLNQQLSARAFTTGQDVFFRQGEYSPGSDSGRKLIAHELAHVVQQSRVQTIQMDGQGKENKATVERTLDSQTIQRVDMATCEACGAKYDMDEVGETCPKCHKTEPLSALKAPKLKGPNTGVPDMATCEACGAEYDMDKVGETYPECHKTEPLSALKAPKLEGPNTGVPDMATCEACGAKYDMDKVGETCPKCHKTEPLSALNSPQFRRT